MNPRCGIVPNHGLPERTEKAVLKNMLPPHNLSIPSLAVEKGVVTATLYKWRKLASGRSSIHGSVRPKAAGEQPDLHGHDADLLGGFNHVTTNRG